MIILRITSGLGNQMFQYAFYNLLKKKYPDTKVLCDVTWFNSFDDHHGYELERIFSGVPGSKFEIEKASACDITRLSGKIPNIFSGAFSNAFEKIRRYPNRLLKNNLLKKRKPFIIDELEGDIPTKDVITLDGNVNNPLYDTVMNLNTENDYFIMGFFISDKYYSQVIDEVRNKLVFPEFTEEHNVSYAKEILSCDSVSIHVRRGDYLSDLYKDRFMTLGREYYEAATKYIENVVNITAEKEGRSPNIKYFIFSDDAEFVRKEFDWLQDKTIVTENTGNDSFRDMQLMSMCKHNIIANSTFSQWGALLNRNENHITVYPRVYMAEEDNEIKKDPSWVRI